MKTLVDGIVYNLQVAKGMLDAFTADLQGSDWTHRVTAQATVPRGWSDTWCSPTAGR